MKFHAIYNALKKTFYCSASSLFLALLAAFCSPGFTQEFVYLVNGDGTVSVVDTSTYMDIGGSPFTAVPYSMGGVSVAIAISPDGTRAYIPSWMASLPNSYVAVMDINSSTGALTHIPGSPFPLAGSAAPFGVVVSPDGTRVYISNSGTDEIAMYDADFNFLGSVSTGMGTSPHGIAIKPDGTRIYAAYTASSQVAMFDAALTPIGAPVASGVIGMNPYAVRVNPAGTRVYVTNTLGDEIDMFDDSLNFIASSTADLVAPIGIAINADGTVVYAANTGNSSVAVLDASTLAPIRMALSSWGSGAYVTELNPDGTLLYITNGGGGPFFFAVYDVNSYMPIAGSPFASPNFQYGIAFTPRSLFPPSNLSGKKEKNDFGLIFEYFNLLQWKAPASGQPAGYFVYRNGVKIATLNGSTLEYKDHDRSKKGATLYAVTAFDFAGNEGAAATITIN